LWEKVLKTKTMEILGGKKQKLVELAKKLRNPTIEKFTGFLIKPNCANIE
jgi:hypothetical protein